MAITVLTYPNVFLDGQTITGAAIDANFNAIKTAVNTTLLKEGNFRTNAGFTNAQKLQSRAWAPAVFAIRRLTLSGGPTATSYSPLLAMEHYAQYQLSPVDKSGSNGTVTSRVAIPKENWVYIESIQARAETLTGAGDTLQVGITYRNALKGTTTTTTASYVAGNTMFSANVQQDNIDYWYVNLAWGIDATPGDHYIDNLVVTVWLKAPHVG